MKPVNISATKRFIIELAVAQQGDILQIAGKLPADVDQVTGAFFSIRSISSLNGLVYLRFSEGISNTLLHQFVTTKHSKRKKAKYIPLREPVSNAATISGYYRDTSAIDEPYSLLIYIEYLPRTTSQNPAK